MKREYKKLPHINRVGDYQFVTIRTQDSLDSYLQKIESFDISSAKKQMAIDGYLDNSAKGRYFEGEVLVYFRSFLLSLDKKLFELVAFSIMPNHLHILFCQKEELSKTMKIVKGGSASGINKILNKNGKFWASGYYDKAIRDEKHFEVVYNYIRNNPLKAGLKDMDRRFWHVYGV
jgi:REP element-mobilizing transposase RayT